MYFCVLTEGCYKHVVRYPFLSPSHGDEWVSLVHPIDKITTYNSLIISSISDIVSEGCERRGEHKYGTACPHQVHMAIRRLSYSPRIIQCRTAPSWEIMMCWENMKYAEAFLVRVGRIWSSIKIFQTRRDEHYMVAQEPNSDGSKMWTRYADPWS